MARRPEPWWWKERQAWFVTIDGVRHSLGRDEEDARQRFHELMAEPRKRPVSSNSVVAVCDAYVDWVEKHRAPDTYRWYKDRLQRFVESIPPVLRVTQLRPFHVQQFIDRMELSSGTKRNYVRAVKRAMAWAEEQGYIDRSPIAHMKKPRGGRREIVITETEFRAILATTRDQEFRDLVSFAWHAGARAAESSALEARHVDLSHNRIVFPIEEEKMERAPRVIYLNDAAMTIVKRLVAKHPEGKLFRNTDGVPWTPNATNCRFQRLAKTTGRKVCLTDFRHTWMNRLLLAGVDGITVAVLAGHSDVSTLSRTYQHLSMNSDYLLGQVQKAPS
jgi:integrase